MSKDIILEVLGHKVKVNMISPTLADGIWHKEDTLDVWLSFLNGESVSATLSFGISLPEKDYSVEALRNAIQKEGERRLAQIMSDHEEAQRIQEDMDARANRLTRLADRLFAELQGK